MGWNGSDDYLIGRSSADKVLVEEVIEHRIELLADVFDEERSAKREAVVEVRAEVFVVQRCDLQLIVALFCLTLETIVSFRLKYEDLFPPIRSLESFHTLILILLQFIKRLKFKILWDYRRIFFIEVFNSLGMS